MKSSDQFFTILCFGTNNLINRQKEPNQDISVFIQKYENLVNEILKAHPHMILITSLFPRGDVNLKQIFVDANKQLKSVFNKKVEIRFVVTYRTFLNQSEPIPKFLIFS